MKLILLVISIIFILVGCKKESEQEYYNKIVAKKAFSSDSAFTQVGYQRALLSSQNNKWSDFNTIENIEQDIENLTKHKNEYPQKADDYDKLIEFYNKWPIRISKGTVHKDDCTNEIIKENIQSFMWTTYHDYLSNRYPEYKLDTIHIGWREIKNNKYGIVLWLPLAHNIQEKDNDSSVCFHLERIDTLTGKYYVPYYKSVIEILIFKSKTPFDKVANHYGFEKQDSLWYMPKLSSEETAADNIDSSGRTLTIRKSLLFTIPIEDDTLISLSSKDTGGLNHVYMYIRQRKSESSDYRYHGEVFFCINESFGLLK